MAVTTVDADAWKQRVTQVNAMTRIVVLAHSNTHEATVGLKVLCSVLRKTIAFHDEVAPAEMHSRESEVAQKDFQ